jgi:hypothetical protein
MKFPQQPPTSTSWSLKIPNFQSKGMRFRSPLLRLRNKWPPFVWGIPTCLVLVISRQQTRRHWRLRMTGWNPRFENRNSWSPTGIHPLHGVEGGRLLEYDNDPHTCVDLNDPELEAFDPHAHQSISPASAEDGEVAPTETPSAPTNTWFLNLLL